MDTISTTSTLEQIRSLHIELESIEHLLIQSLVPIVSLIQSNINIHYYDSVVELVEKYRSTIQQCIELYNNSTEQLIDEQNSIQQPTIELQLKSYYNNVEHIKLMHTMVNSPSINIKQLVHDLTEYNNYDTNRHELIAHVIDHINQQYTVDEYYGNYLDLQQFYHTFLNVDIFRLTYRHLDYIQFIQQLPTILNTTNPNKYHHTVYNQWLQQLIDYLYHYIERIYPFSDRIQMKQLIHDEYIKLQTEHQSDATDVDTNLSNQTTLPAQSATTQLSLYCRACDKLFAKQTVYDAHLTGKKHMKNTVSLPSQSTTTAAATTTTPTKLQLNTVQYHEYVILQLLELLSEQYNNTLVYIQQKHIRSTKELQSDRDHLVKQIELLLQHKSIDTMQSVRTSDNEIKPIYNPLSLPLGIDGEPIPYWMYRLHGLNHEYTCEICGNYTYYGDRSYQSHFNEWRHIYGLKCLNITNNLKLYDNITKIDELMALYKQQQSISGQESMNTDVIQEIEDSDGNVYNKKTYEELRKQGIL